MKNNIKYGSLLFVALSLIILSVLALSGLQEINKFTNNPSRDNVKNINNTLQDSPQMENNDEPLYCEARGLLAALNDEQLNNYSDIIMIGTVKEILPSKWNSADGKRPGNIKKFSIHNFIYTDVVVNVDRYLKNQLPSEVITVRLDGGTVGKDTFIMSGEANLKLGEKVLLYLQKDTNPDIKDIGPEHYRVTGGLQGKFTLDDNGKAIRPDKSTTLDKLLSTTKNESNSSSGS
ncbi:MAG: hypothetical protein ACPK85_09720 [Methanosarcina sp.]